jgi:hypothetical protein
MILPFQLQFDQRPSPPGPAVVWMRISLQESSIKYESQKWVREGVASRQGSRSVNTAPLKTLTMGRIVGSAVFHCDGPRDLGDSQLELPSYNDMYRDLQYATSAGDSSCSMGRISQPAV